MEQFTGYEYLMIDVANSWGLDRLPWQERIFWVKDNWNDLEDLLDQCGAQYAYEKSVKALRTVERGQPTNHMVGLDATASGIQVMSCMAGDTTGAETVNLVDTTERRCVYQDMATQMGELTGKEYTRKDLKHPCMTYFYGSTKTPESIFGADTEELEAFYRTLSMQVPGASSLRDMFLDMWDPTATNYEWAMPDGHYAYVPVVLSEEKGVEIDEAHHFRYTMRTLKCSAKNRGRALAANIVHSVDGWVCREMVKRANKQGFRVSPIHDCFYTSPNNCNQMRRNYVEILAELAEMNMVRSICHQLWGRDRNYRKMSGSSKLPELIRNSNYALS
jgi:DNA-directed RNA polymerase